LCHGDPPTAGYQDALRLSIKTTKKSLENGQWLSCDLFSSAGPIFAPATRQQIGQLVATIDFASRFGDLPSCLSRFPGHQRNHDLGVEDLRDAV
jgi:hypothetical protein